MSFSSETSGLTIRSVGDPHIRVSTMEKAAISAWVLIIGFVAFCSMVILYRLHIHPLSKFPGPKLAAATGLYAFYFNVIKNGVYIWKIQEMHDRYGQWPWTDSYY
jgi:hypothetical protein